MFALKIKNLYLYDIINTSFKTIQLTDFEYFLCCTKTLAIFLTTRSVMIQIRTFFAIFLLFFMASCISSQTDKAMNKQIKLFIYPSCPYCHKVINFLKEIGKLDQITIMNVQKKENMTELLSLTNNNTQCPYLFDEINNIGMHESDDIIAYFKTRFA